MNSFLTVGITHDDAAIGGLERVAAAAADKDALRERALAAGCAEVMVLSTCSRIELHTVLDLPAYADAASRKASWAVADRLIGLLLGDCREPVGRATVVRGEDAVRHLFRTAAGLESRIVGEVEVQAQLRAAARAATARQGDAHRLRRVVTAALTAARETSRAHPGLLRRGLLVERAVSGALVGHPDGQPVEAVVVGAGTMGRQVLEALPAARSRATLLSRRSSANGGGPPVRPLGELPERLSDADVLFVATSAGRRLLSAELVLSVMQQRPGRSLTVVDLSLPRNVDPAVAAVPGVRLLNLDDLGDRGSGATPEGRAVAAATATAEAAADAYCAEMRSRRAGPLIASLRTGVEETCLEQLRRVTRGMALPEETLVRMAAAVAGAVAHAPTVLARQAAAEDDAAALALLRAAFRLDGRDRPDVWSVA
jgi:glutamyl-tRNA reductase